MKSEIDENLNTRSGLQASPLGGGGGFAVGGFGSALFITGIGTGIGKTLVSAIVTEALGADYWKPIQAGMDGTDKGLVKSLVTNIASHFHDEVYSLQMPASPHIAAREEGITINIDTIVQRYNAIAGNKPMVIEGAGGIMVPLNENEFIADLIERLNATVILVSRNYLGSINHSLLTAALCRQKNLRVAGWIFNDQYLQYEDEIAAWSGFPRIASIPHTNQIDKAFVRQQARLIKPQLMQAVGL